MDSAAERINIKMGKTTNPRGLFMRLLLVEDDTKIASFVVKGLEEAGFAVDHAADGEEGLYPVILA